MILDEFVEVNTRGLNTAIKQRYEFLGYTIPKGYSKINIKITDLPAGSGLRVNVKCDFCNNDKNIVWQKYFIQTNGLVNLYKCRECFEHSYEKAFSDFSEKDLTPLFNEYHGVKELLTYTCNKHPNTLQRITHDQVLRGHGCYFCGVEKVRQHQLTNIATIKDNFIKDGRGYILLSTEYISSKDKLEYICPKHPNEVQYISLNNFNRKRGCRFCGRASTANKLRGCNSSSWKGGVTSMQSHLRNRLLPWIIESAKVSKSRCVITNKSGSVSVHHLKSFNEIFNETLEESGLAIKQPAEYDLSELLLLETLILKNHFKHGLGVCVNKKLHQSFHKLYGKTNTTPEQFEEFKQRYLAGEFCDSSESSQAA